MLADQDDSARLLDQVQQAGAAAHTLRIAGHGSKAALLPTPGGDEYLLSTVEHRGVEAYVPDELVLRVRSGTPIDDVKRLLAQQGQMLPWDPPLLNGRGTIGGAVASGLAGPARPWSGGVRDSVLGVEIINGLGERLRFGGEVMKNVAGYDVSRLQAGAWGTLGVLLSVSLRVAPVHSVERTLKVDVSDGPAAYDMLAQLGQGSLPLSGAAYDPAQPEVVAVRLSGPAHAVDAALGIGADGGDLAADSWAALRDQSHPVFDRAGEPLWRVQVPLGTPQLEMDAMTVAEWAGALRWVRSADEAALRAQVARFGGHLRAYHLADPLAAPGLNALGARVRHAFDPHGVFNRSIGPSAD